MASAAASSSGDSASKKEAEELERERSEFVCPITREMLREPVRVVNEKKTEEGVIRMELPHSYCFEREAAETHIRSKDGVWIDPLTRTRFDNPILIRAADVEKSVKMFQRIKKVTEKHVKNAATDRDVVKIKGYMAHCRQLAVELAVSGYMHLSNCMSRLFERLRQLLQSLQKRVPQIADINLALMQLIDDAAEEEKDAIDREKEEVKKKIQNGGLTEDEQSSVVKGFCAALKKGRALFSSFASGLKKIAKWSLAYAKRIVKYALGGAALGGVAGGVVGLIAGGPYGLVAGGIVGAKVGASAFALGVAALDAIMALGNLFGWW